ncbi:hypothetical protein PQC39_gp101 [Vibrio phage Vp_R1]|uniref:Uncharacterized protein n=1 Tax=Vibrio phage Vp_R1 TaxID=2059867 RepID=A0A2H5BQ72_9CAUD|nr:hypothetical protein PQC39_gp101 [Vibrio phage Vp_R1]AUG88465.1 hypothetical protein VPR_101 [Vibrio phage Vp_R1]
MAGTVTLRLLNPSADKAVLSNLDVANIDQMLNSDGVCAIFTGSDGEYYHTKRVNDVGIMVNNSLSQAGLDSFNVKRVRFELVI